jgi:hypothetical protein
MGKSKSWDLSARFFGGVYRSRVCVFIKVSVCVGGREHKLHKSGHITFCSGITTETTNHLYHNYTQAVQEIFFSAFNMKTREPVEKQWTKEKKKVNVIKYSSHFSRARLPLTRPSCSLH